MRAPLSMIVPARVFVPALTLLLSAPAVAQESDPAATPLVRAMQDELQRSMEKLQLNGKEKPYFLAYTVFDHAQLELAAYLGSLTRDNVANQRFFRADLRVGNYQLDNGGFVGGFDSFAPGYEIIPMDDDYDAIRREIWLATDRSFKRAVEQLGRKRAALESRSESEERPPDFTPAEALQITEPGTPPALQGEAFRGLVARLSKLFANYPAIQWGGVHLNAVSYRRHFASSDGVLVVEPGSVVLLEIRCRTQAEDGAELTSSRSFASRTLDGLPAEEILAEATHALAKELVARRDAAEVEPYVGPVLFEGIAAPQLMRHLLVPRLAGTPPPTVEDPRMAPMFHTPGDFSEKIGRPVMPKGFRVEDNPMQTTKDGTPLFGYYRVDDEGVAAAPVVLIDNGRLETLLMSRTPSREIASSNGHGRGGIGGTPRAYHANLRVSSKRGESAKALHKKLLSLAKKEGLDHGVIIRSLDENTLGDSAGSHFRRMFGKEEAVQPLIVVRLNADGSETPLRSAEIPQLSERLLREIVAAGSDAYVDAYLADIAPGSNIRASVSAPALLIEEVEIRKQQRPKERPPLLERPVVAATGAAE